MNPKKTKSLSIEIASKEAPASTPVELSTSFTMSNNMPIFNFGKTQIRVQIDDATGEVWFLAKDICNALEFGNPRQAIDSHVDNDDVRKLDIGVVTGKKADGSDAIQKVKQNFINESGLYALIFGSTKPEAKEFKRYVTSVILPTIRKTGSFSLARQVLISDLLLQIPSEWEKTFPDEFFKLSVEMVTGLEFDRSRGTPACIGGFINKYIYDFLDADIVRIAKQNREDCEKHYAYIHQFLDAKFGKEALKAHINVVINIMKASRQDYDIFKALMTSLAQSKNQNSLLLKA